MSDIGWGLLGREPRLGTRWVSAPPLSSTQPLSAAQSLGTCRVGRTICRALQWWQLQQSQCEAFCLSDSGHFHKDIRLSFSQYLEVASKTKGAMVRDGANRSWSSPLQSCL